MKITKFLFLFLFAGQVANATEVDKPPFDIQGTVIKNNDLWQIKCFRKIYTITNMCNFPHLQEGLKATFNVKEDSIASDNCIEILAIKPAKDCVIL